MMRSREPQLENREMMRKYNLKNQKLNPLFYLLLIFFCSPLLGLAEQKTYSSKEIKFLTIKAVHLNLKVKKTNSKLYKIKWTGPFSFQNKNGLLKVESKDFNSKHLWNIKSSKNPLTLEISGPSVPIKIFTFSNNSSFSKWTKPVFLSGFKGNVKAGKNIGPWEITLKEGAINIDKHQGSLSVKGFRLNSFITSSKGSFQFHTNEGELKIKKSQGELNFTTDKGKVRLTQFKGSLKGFSQSGTITAFIQPEKVDLFSRESSIRISFMGQSPRVKAYTERGKIYGPRYFYKQFSGKSIKVSGRIRGSNKKGEVSLKSDTGNIYIN